MSIKSVVQAIHDAMDEEMHRDPSVLVLGQDVGVRGGVFLATDGLVDKFGSSRIIDTPLSEGLIAGMAVGLAMKGLRPIAEIQFSDFWWYAANQIIGEASRIFYGSNGQLSIPMVVRIPYGGGIRGGLFHSQSIESYLYNTPGLKVIAPATPFDAKGLLKSAIRDNNPVIFLEHKKTYRGVKGEIPDPEYTIPIGKADVKRRGNDITLICYVLAVHLGMEAAANLHKQGLEVEVVDLRSLLPLDKDTILGSVKKTGKVLIVHESNLTGGVGAEIAATIGEQAFNYLDAPIMRLCGPDVPAMGYAPTLEAAYLINAEKITQALLDLARY